MTENRRERVTIESEHVLIVEKQQITRGWCERCGLEVELQTRGQAETPLSTFAENPPKTYRDWLPPLTATSFLEICKKQLLRLLLSTGNRNPSR